MNKQQKIAVYALIKNLNNEVLIIRRSKNDSMPGIWELPGGGLEFGEIPSECIQREVNEEVGLEVKATKPLKIISMISDKDTKQTIRIYFKCKLISTDKNVELSKDHDAFKWIKIRGINNLIPSVKNI